MEALSWYPAPTEEQTRDQPEHRKAHDGILELTSECGVTYHSPWTDPAMAGCGGDRDTEGRAGRAGQPAPGSNLSIHPLVWACTVASKHQFNMHS